jgi:hypothetical protein
MKKITFSLLLVLLMTAIVSFGQGKHITKQSAAGVKGVTYAIDAPSLLFSQMTPSTDPAIASQTFPDYGNCSLQGADDFTVPAGPSWNVSRVDVIGQYYAGPINFFDVIVYADAAGSPGAPVYSATGLAFTQSTNVFTINLTSAAVLPAGTYWISVVANMPFIPNGQYYWQVNAGPLAGSNLFWRDPCNLATGFTNWTPGPVAFPGFTNYDLCFALYGNNFEVPVSNWALFIGIGLILVFAVVRFRRVI